jgi:hypothetical protein
MARRRGCWRNQGAVIVRQWILIGLSVLSASAAAATAPSVQSLDEAAAARFAHLALACTHK